MPVRRMYVVGMILAVVAALSFAAAAQEAAETKDVFNARALNMGGGPTGASTTLLITITRWSTNEERMMLLNTLKEKGHEDFMKALLDQKEAGFFRGVGRASRANPFPSTRLQAAWQFERDGQREVVLVAERPISGSEAASAAMSLDYDTTVILMQFPADDEDAKGTGLLYRALKIRYNNEKEKLEVEQMGREAVRLTEITKEK